MGTQLLPPNRPIFLESRNEPRTRLEQLHADRREAKAELREVLERLAQRWGVSQQDINYALEGYADNMLSDLIYGIERDLEHQAEEQDAA